MHRAVGSVSQTERPAFPRSRSRQRALTSTIAMQETRDLQKLSCLLVKFCDFTHRSLNISSRSPRSPKYRHMVTNTLSHWKAFKFWETEKHSNFKLLSLDTKNFYFWSDIHFFEKKMQISQVWITTVLCGLESSGVWWQISANLAPVQPSVWCFSEGDHDTPAASKRFYVYVPFHAMEYL